MPSPIQPATFGDALKFARRKAQLTQRELAIAVGYTEAHICRLEKNERKPDLTTIAALFIPALYLEDEPELTEKLLSLAASQKMNTQPWPVSDGPSASRLLSEEVDAAIIASGLRDGRLEESQMLESSLLMASLGDPGAAESEEGFLETIPEPDKQHIHRAAVFERLQHTLHTQRSVAICGLPGMGKTTLAASLARSFKKGPVFWMPLTAGLNTTFEAIVRQIAIFLYRHGQTQVRPLIERRSDILPMPFEQQLALLKNALERLPVLLCFDDAHLLLDQANSLELLRALSTLPAAHLLLTSRQELPLPIVQVSLQGLDGSEGSDLLERLGLKLNPASLRLLLERTGASPMLLRLAAAQVDAAAQPGEAALDAVKLIENLENQPQVAAYLLRTVLHGLSAPALLLAELIAIFRQPLDLQADHPGADFGEQFERLLADAPDLPAPTAGPAGSLDQALTELQRRFLVENRRAAALHPLVRDHLFGVLQGNLRRKKALHRAAADWCECALEEPVEAAHHWLRAGDVERAAEIIAEQTERLFTLGLALRAAAVVDEALSAIRQRRQDADSLRRSLLVARGDLLRGTLRAAESEKSYREALTLAQGQPTVRAHIVRAMALSLMQRGQAAEALGLCQSARAELAPTDTILIARLAAVECRAHLLFSNFEEAERTASLAISLAGQFAELVPSIADDVRARAERSLGWICFSRRQQGEESLRHYFLALEYARRADLSQIEAAVRSNIATVYTERGDFERARQFYLQALAAYEHMGDLYGTAGILHNLGFLQNAIHDDLAALEYFDRASQIERLIGDNEGLLSTEGARASLLVAVDRVAEARSVLERVLLENQQSSDPWTVGTCLCLQVEILCLQGEAASARQTLQRLQALKGLADNTHIHTWMQTSQAMVELLAGNFSAALAVVGSPPPQDVNHELALRWMTLRVCTFLLAGDLPAARSAAEQTRQAAVKHQSPVETLKLDSILAIQDGDFQHMLRLIMITDSQ